MPEIEEKVIPDSEGRIVEQAYYGLCMRGEALNAMSLTREVLSIKQMMSDTSLAVIVQRATRFIAVIDNIGFEESSQRYLIDFKSMTDGTEEQIRSDRIDGKHGKVAKQLWKKELAGHKVVIYKHNEKVGESKRNSNGYRTAVWVTDLGLARR